MPAVIEVNYFNSFWLKKIVDGRAASTLTPGPFPEIDPTTLPSRNVFPGVINPVTNTGGTGFPYFAQAGTPTVIPGDSGVVPLLDWHKKLE